MKVYIKVLSLIAAFVATFFIVTEWENSASEVKLTTIGEAKLPIVYVKSDSGLDYNEMHGYTCKMDMYEACEWLTIIRSDRKLNIDINQYNANVTGISYEVRSKDGSNLYEDTTVKNYTQESGIISAQLSIKNLLEADTEYILKIKLATDDYEEVAYYTVIKIDDKADVDKKADFVKWFSATTLDRSELSVIRKYIETKSDADNSDYSYVNIYSSLSMFGYGDLNIEKIGGEKIYVSQIDGIDAIIYQDFVVCTNDNGEEIYYDVREKYTLSEGTSGGIYLMGYERYMDQRFDEHNAVMPSSRIYMGVSSDKDIEYKEDEKERYTAFVANSDLYMYDIKENELTNIFSFSDKENDNVREAYKKHNIRIIDVNKDGDIIFSVYGYMNRGLHEGEMGASVMKYSKKTNNINEIVFIPVECSYETLAGKFADIVYVNDDNTITVMIDGSLYAIDSKSGETTVVIDSLKEGDYSVDITGHILAYVKDNRIIRYNLQDQTEKVLECQPDETIRNIGFIDTDYTYGIVKNDDILYDPNGNTFYPMYKVYILNEKDEVIKEYGIEGAYVTDYEIIGKRVNFIRVRKEGNSYVYIEKDQLLNKSDNLAPDNANVKLVATSKRKNEVYLALSKNVSNVNKLKYNYAKKVEFGDEKQLAVISMQKGYDTRKFECANMYGTCNTSFKMQDIMQNSTYDGNTLAACTDIVLTRLGKSVNVEQSFAEGETIVSLLDSCQGVTGCNITGATLKQALNFVSMKSLVVAMRDYNHYGIITGYTRSNVLFYDVNEQKVLTIDKEEFEVQMNSVGNVYITYYCD